jgi:hypothetical protein
MVRINIFTLFLGLFCGFFLVYIITPSPKIVLKYPTIEDVNKTTFVDDDNICYRYYAEEVKC